MTVVRILIGLIQAILRVIASALTAGLSLVVVGLLAVAVLVGLAVFGVSGLGTLDIVRRRRKQQKKDG